MLTDLSIVTRLVEYNVNELIIIIHISIAQQVGLKMFQVLIWYSLIECLYLVYRKYFLIIKN